MFSSALLHSVREGLEMEFEFRDIFLTFYLTGEIKMKKILWMFLATFCAGGLFAKSFTFSIGAGANYKERSNPQIAVWITDADGKIEKTLYVTQRASKKNWIGKPKNGRPESLPVWYHFANNNDESLITDLSHKGAENESLDAITSATPKGGLFFDVDYDFIKGKDYYIYAELNNSFDYNDNFTKKSSGVNGQPSVVYKAKINSQSEGEVKLDFAGTGSVNGSDGDIHDEGDKLTTAKNIVKLIVVKFND